jgi:threonine/homoserine/homoserine lactone efflux protein
MDPVFFSKGLIIGFLIAAPVGPIGILCARRTLTQGRRAGFASGLGAATADAIYGFIAAFGLTFISDMIVEHQSWLRAGGGFLLCVLGVRTYRAEPRNDKAIQKTGRVYAGMYTSTFLLTLTNPLTIFSLAAVFAGFGLTGTRGSMLSAAVLILGVFLGSGIWWLLLVGAVSIFRQRFDSRMLGWVNKIAGLIIGGSGILALITLWS